MKLAVLTFMAFLRKSGRVTGKPSIETSRRGRLNFRVAIRESVQR